MVTIERQVGAGADDGDYSATWGFRSGNTFIYISHDAETMKTWFRFTNVTVPKNATVSAATLKVKCGANLAAGGTLRIQAFDEANAVAPADGADYDGRDKTTAFVDWSLPQWIVDTYVSSDDIKNVIQEIVDRGDWVSGNALVICAYNTDQVTQKYIRSQEYDDNLQGAKLEITYTAGVSIPVAMHHYGHTIGKIIRG